MSSEAATGSASLAEATVMRDQGLEQMKLGVHKMYVYDDVIGTIDCEHVKMCKDATNGTHRPIGLVTGRAASHSLTSSVKQRSSGSAWQTRNSKCILTPCRLTLVWGLTRVSRCMSGAGHACSEEKIDALLGISCSLCPAMLK